MSEYIFLIVSFYMMLVISEESLSCANTTFFSKSSCFFDNDAHKMKSAKVGNAAACCAMCVVDSGCKSWMLNGTNNKNICTLFNTIGDHPRAGNCISGWGADRPPHPYSPPQPPYLPRPPKGPVCKNCPNIIFSLTDDQDVDIGGWVPMKKTQALLQNGGAFLNEWRIHTPICSPSRSETISGRYFHNIKSTLAVPPPMLLPAATGHINGSLYANQTFSTLLRQKKGYNVAIFGKSNFNANEGFDRWFQGACLGYGCKFEDNESPTFHYKSNASEYATSLLGNKSIDWLNRDNITGASSEGRPFFLYFAPHCPHTPAVPADWYKDECKGVISSRNPAYNHSNPSFHELVAKQPPLTHNDAILIDDLARRRCQCLMSVDDAHAALVKTTKDLGVFDNTYWFISSDHGYNLGHHRIPSNKFLLYDHSLRIPMVVRGPGIPAGNNSVLGSNVDYAPTWLGLAGIPTPDYMDGRSILTQLIPTSNESKLPAPTLAHVREERKKLEKKPWRKAQFLEYYNQGGPSPLDAPDGLPWNSEGWAPGSSSNPTQTNGGLKFPKFPRDNGLVSTIRPLDDYSNTYIGVHVVDSSIGNGRYKYAEYQYACSTNNILSKKCFSNPDMRELFDLTTDPYELHNIYNQTDKKITNALAEHLRKFYPCKGTDCP